MPLRQRSITLDAVRGFQIFLAIVTRPWLWWIAIRQALRIARPAWWRHAPFLPVPDAEYLRFRLETGYGEVIVPPAADLVSYLEWCAEARAGRPRAIARGRR
jgi:hypothetical protein